MDNVATQNNASGLKDWLVQRVTAVVLAVYILFLLDFIIVHPELPYHVWHDLFAATWMRIFSLMALLSLVLHAWIGIWGVLTDYVKCVWMRLSLEIIVVLALIGYFLWAVNILWSVS